MTQTIKMVIIAIVAALIGSGGVYMWQINKSPDSPSVSTQEQPENITISSTEGAVKYNCELSGGSFSNNNCTCLEEESFREINKYNCENTGTCLNEQEVKDLVYDKNTGFCQTMQGGPAGDAFYSSIGLPYGDYDYYQEIVINNCNNSGGQHLTTCNCPAGKSYDKKTGYCN